MLQGTSGGKCIIRLVGFEHNFMEIPMNGNSGVISNVSLNFVDNLVVASNTDGALTVHQLDKEMIEAKAKESTELPENCRYRNQESEITLDNFDVDLASKLVRDIDDPKIYSIQNDKLRSEHDKLMAEAEK